MQEVAERAQLLVREEIELAKTEITEKVTKLLKGAAVAAAAGVFAIFGLSILIQGFAWLAYFVLPIGNDFSYFWGFFFVAIVLFILGGIAGYVASRLFKSGAPPTPEMAIEEAQRIRETVQGD